MSRIGLTNEERALVGVWARQPAGAARTVGDFLAWYGPIFVFAIYGMVVRDWVAIGLALGLFLILKLWHLVSQLRDSRLSLAIFTKIDAFERAVPPADGGAT